MKKQDERAGDIGAIIGTVDEAALVQETTTRAAANLGPGAVFLQDAAAKFTVRSRTTPRVFASRA